MKLYYHLYFRIIFQLVLIICLLSNCLLISDFFQKNKQIIYSHLSNFTAINFKRDGFITEMKEKQQTILMSLTCIGKSNRLFS